MLEEIAKRIFHFCRDAFHSLATFLAMNFHSMRCSFIQFSRFAALNSMKLLWIQMKETENYFSFSTFSFHFNCSLTFDEGEMKWKWEISHRIKIVYTIVLRAGNCESFLNSQFIPPSRIWLRVDLLFISHFLIHFNLQLIILRDSSFPTQNKIQTHRNFMLKSLMI